MNYVLLQKNTEKQQNMSDNQGSVYFIQPAELVGTNRYKIGMSNKPTPERILKDYKNGTIPIIYRRCNSPLQLEKLLKTTFGQNFPLCAGKEWFTIDDIEKAISIFDECCSNHGKTQADNIKMIMDKYQDLSSLEPEEINNQELLNYINHKLNNNGFTKGFIYAKNIEEHEYNNKILNLFSNFEYDDYKLIIISEDNENCAMLISKDVYQLYIDEYNRTKDYSKFITNIANSIYQFGNPVYYTNEIPTKDILFNTILGYIKEN